MEMVPMKMKHYAYLNVTTILLSTIVLRTNGIQISIIMDVYAKVSEVHEAENGFVHPLYLPLQAKYRKVQGKMYSRYILVRRYKIQDRFIYAPVTRYTGSQ